MAKITLNIKDHGTHEFDSGVTTLDIKEALNIKETPFLGKLNGERINPTTPITESGDFKFRIDPMCGCANDETNVIAAWAVGNHLVDSGSAISVKETGIEDDKFWVDVVVEKPISEKQFQLIEGKVKKALSKNPEQDISPLDSKHVKELKLLAVSGVESEEGTVNRLFGISAINKQVLETQEQKIKELEERDHRKIGKELDLFFIDETIGKGLPVWLPNGLALKNEIKNYILKKEDEYGYEQIETPVIGSKELYEISGHYSHYKDSMFPEMDIEDGAETFMLRPMSCPHHVMVYKRKPHSFRDLPVRYAEQVKQYRFETSGSLIGLERVRAMELTDSHIFLREDQLKEEIESVYNLVKETLEKFNIEIHYIELALHDKNKPEKYHGDSEMWNKSEQILEDFLKNNNIEYTAMEGEAAFYGPKIDIQIKTALGHIITVSTIQLDFLLPEKFDISYIDSEKNKIRPIMIHRGLIGTYERFISVLLEQTKGNLPMWLAPTQAVVIPVSNEHHGEYAQEVFNKLKEEGVRVILDDSEERLSNKIRIHQTSKVKTQIILGDEEKNNNTVSYRNYGEEETTTVSLDELVKIYNGN